jgi:hypothetical protein
VHDAPGFCKAISVKNTGEGTLYVSWGPALSGTADPTTQDCWELATGEGRLISFVGDAPERPLGRQYSTFGEDGEDHPMLLVFESVP